ncbi:ABC transporter A family member 7-like isoform X2 [Phragmites australis]|uniref:ABC transporter A family member 7-like isoform X2 n=1 Tax=Phragmites australis TaxID=29695 RepID=UPI002D796996|nr:ABC transporter A family member 7-like isoform X2 [Phragmites australis]
MDSAAPSRGPASFPTQANALLRKNLCFQKRNMRTNACITLFPVLLCVLLVVLQGVIDRELSKPKYRCGCSCVDPGPGAAEGACRRTECGVQHSTLDQVGSCPIPRPTKWPALVQVPRPESRAVRTASQPLDGLPNPTCRDTGSCPASVLVTGNNRTLAESLSGGLFPALSSPLNFTDYLDALSKIVAGSDTSPWTTQFIEPVFIPGNTLYLLQPQCLFNLSQTVSYNAVGIPLQLNIDCIQGLSLWRESASVINDELFKGYRQQNRGSGGGKTNEFVAGYDFLNTNMNGLEINIWYNSTYNNNTAYGQIALLRVPRLVNTASNAYIKFLRGSGVEMLLEYVKDMPKVGTKQKFDLSSLLGALFFTWIIELLFPVILSYLVYEKQQKLKIMMKMHGLKDGPYWLISYVYFFALSAFYMILFVIFGSLIGLNFFKLNDYSIQFVFYFIYINLQIALAFFVASIFSSVKIATVVGYIYVFGSGLLGAFLLRFFVEDTSFPKGWIVVMEIIPGFSLYRGLYEFGRYAFSANAIGTNGMEWANLDDPVNGMRVVLIIMVVEWAILLPLTFYMDQVSSLGGGIRKNPLFFLRCFKKRALSLRRYSFGRQGSKVVVEMDNPDSAQEREVVEQLLLEGNENQAIICDNLKKVYHGKDGNPDKLAVRGLSLALPKGQCFGMLGPNGAGKTSFISMMIGLIPPTSGTAYVHGMDITTDMDEIYTNMGVCPQHDLLWETLTGKEHLLFYGRLKNLKGTELLKAVDDSLKSVNLFHGGVGNKQVGKYSGGMKRRLSVAISLIGDPKTQ